MKLYVSCFLLFFCYLTQLGLLSLSCQFLFLFSLEMGALRTQSLLLFSVCMSQPLSRSTGIGKTTTNSAPIKLCFQEYEVDILFLFFQLSTTKTLAIIDRKTLERWRGDLELNSPATQNDSRHKLKHLKTCFCVCVVLEPERGQPSKTENFQIMAIRFSQTFQKKKLWCQPQPYKQRLSRYLLLPL